MTSNPIAETFTCPDCTTPRLAPTTAEGLGTVIAVAHDPSCPRYAAMTRAERTEITDGGAVVHILITDRPAT